MSCMVAGTLCHLVSAVFDFIKTIVQLARSGPPKMWQDHQISRASGPMVHCLEMLISSPDAPCKYKTITRGCVKMATSGR